MPQAGLIHIHTGESFYFPQHVSAILAWIPHPVHTHLGLSPVLKVLSQFLYPPPQPLLEGCSSHCYGALCSPLCLVVSVASQPLLEMAQEQAGRAEEAADHFPASAESFAWLSLLPVCVG